MNVSDQNGCSISIENIEIAEPENPITITETHSDYSGYGVSQADANDGWIDLEVFGGTGDYSFEWSNGETQYD